MSPSAAPKRSTNRSASSRQSAIVVGVVRHKPQARLAWLLLAASQGLFGLGDIVYFNASAPRRPIRRARTASISSRSSSSRVALLLLASRSTHGARSSLLCRMRFVIALAIGLLIWSALFEGSFGTGDACSRPRRLGRLSAASTSCSSRRSCMCSSCGASEPLRSTPLQAQCCFCSSRTCGTWFRR